MENWGFRSEKLTSREGTIREEIFRKSVHIGCGLAISVLYRSWQGNFVIGLLIFSLVMVFFLEFLRLRGVVSVPLLRDTERKKIGGHAFFMVGAFMSILLFEKQIAIASILMLTIGDASSGIAQSIKRGALGIGEGHTGKIKPIDEILIMFGVSLLVGYAAMDSLSVAACGAFGAAIADGVILGVYGFTVNDNLTIPLYSGLLMSLAS